MSILENAGAAAAPAPEGLIKETTTQGFMKDVIEESKRQPVLIDFWAPWCGPCKQLTPILEKVVKNAKGKVKLVKMNIDEHPAIPGQMGIQSIPAVIAFVNGQPADGFMGALPESQVNLREWATRIAADARARGTRPALFTVWPESYRFAVFPDVLASYRNAARAARAELFPAGAAWRAAWRRDPKLPLYGPDGFHPSRLGSYLAAVVIYAGLVKAPPVGLPRLGVSAKRARVLQAAAADALRRT